MFNSPRRQSYFMHNANVYYVKDSRGIDYTLNIVTRHTGFLSRKSPSYPTFTSKVVLELRGQLPHILWALRCSWAHTHLCGEAPRLSKSGLNIVLNLGGFYLTPPSGPSVGTARHRQTAV